VHAPIEMLGGRDYRRFRACVDGRDKRAHEVVVVTGSEGDVLRPGCREPDRARDVGDRERRGSAGPRLEPLDDVREL
jgi:hypothetical protein